MLRQIVKEGNLIHANIGPSAGKMARILGQADTWYEEFGDLLRRCGVPDSLAPVANGTVATPTGLATPEEVKAAVENAESNISLDLNEARALRELGERIQKWQESVTMAAPKRSKRVIGKGGREESRYTVNDLLKLIDESTTLPVNTDEDVERLRQQLQDVHKWRLAARRELGSVANNFRVLRQAVIADYGLPDEYYDEESREYGRKEKEEDIDPTNGMDLSGSVLDATGSTESMDNSSQADESQTGSDSDMEGDGNALVRMISSLLSSAKLIGVRTPEEEVCEVLEKTAKWILKSLLCIDSPKKVYDKKSFRRFDELVATGEELLVFRDSLQELDLVDGELLQSLASSSGDLVSDQLVRIKILKAHRDKFVAWFENAQEVISSKEERATLQALNELAEQSRDYPASKLKVKCVQNNVVRGSRN